jgi:hypothetical protein
LSSNSVSITISLLATPGRIVTPIGSGFPRMSNQIVNSSPTNRIMDDALEDVGRLIVEVGSVVAHV